jgi:clan AA aspartic protease
MGIVQVQIILKNATDVGDCKRGFIKAQEVREARVTVVVDTGAATLVINEDLRRQLGLEILGTKQVTLANNSKEMIKIAEPVEIHWKDRSMVCRPWVVSGNGAILLGAIPLEDMDLMVDPSRLELVGTHGDENIGYLLGVGNGGTDPAPR